MSRSFSSEGIRQRALAPRVVSPSLTAEEGATSTEAAPTPPEVPGV